MLDSILSQLKENVPGAFLDEKPSIPWVNEDTKIINSREIFDLREVPIFPPIFIDPEAEIIEVDEELEGEIRESGTDTLAWYVSFHQSNQWGIYFRVRGLCYLSNFFKTKKNLNDPNERIKRAFDVLFYHEFFHFLTDITAANMEMIYLKPVYNEYLRFLRQHTKSKGLHIEEPLANAYVLKRTQKRWHSRVKTFFNIQPSPYSQFYNFMSEPNFLRGKRKLGAIVRTHNIPEIVAQALTSLPDTNEPFWEFLFNVDPEKLFLPDIPIYFVIEKKHPTGVLKFITPIFMGTQVAVYPSDHPPPHLHIWIPANSKNDGRYLYPSLDPYMGAKPLSNKGRKKVQKIIKRYRNKIESIIERQKQHW